MFAMVAAKAEPFPEAALLVKLVPANATVNPARNVPERRNSTPLFLKPTVGPTKDPSAAKPIESGLAMMSLEPMVVPVPVGIDPPDVIPPSAVLKFVKDCGAPLALF